MPLISKRNINKYSKNIQKYVILYVFGSESHTAIENDIIHSGLSEKDVDITHAYLDGYLLSVNELNLLSKSINNWKDQYTFVKLDKKHDQWTNKQIEYTCDTLSLETRKDFIKEFGSKVEYKDIKQYLTI